MESSESPLIGAPRRLLNKVWGAYRSMTARLTGTEEVAPEDIDPQKVAQVILTNLTEKMSLGDRTGIIFTVPTIAGGLGYVPFLADTDYRKKFPGVYDAVRRQVDLLVTGGVLERVPLKEATVNNETLGYRVSDNERLRKVAQSPQIDLPAKP